MVFDNEPDEEPWQPTPGAPLAPELAPGAIIDGKYTIISLLGRGAQSSVYKALHMALGEDVAIKFIRGKSPGDTRRLYREARILQQIHHDNVVRVYNCGVSDGVPFVVMALLKGRTLEAELSSIGRLERERSVEIFRQIGAGLQCAHAANILHRDVKPANVMLLEDDTVVLVDFGIAKQESVSPDQALTETNVLRGTPLYMSPERCSNKGEDARSDIYSFGCLMFECLTGQPPFTGETAFMVLSMHLTAPLVVPPDLKRDQKFSHLIEKCMAKAPEDRFSSVAELLTALDEASGDDGGTALQPVRARSSKAVIGLVWGTLILIAIVVVFVSISRPWLAPSVVLPESVTREPGRRAPYRTWIHEAPTKSDDVSDEFFKEVLKSVSNSSTPAQIRELRNKATNTAERHLVNEVVGRAYAVEGARLAMQKHGSSQKALEFFQKATSLLTKTGRSESGEIGLAEVSVRTAVIYTCQGDYDRALKLFDAARHKRLSLWTAAKVNKGERACDYGITLFYAAAANLSLASNLPKGSERSELTDAGRRFGEEGELVLRELARSGFSLSNIQIEEFKSVGNMIFPKNYESNRHLDLDKVLAVFRGSSLNTRTAK